MFSTRHNDFRRDVHRMPTMFKIWFGLIISLILGIIGLNIWLFTALMNLGPEGIGNLVGSIVRGFNGALQ
jgi:hypothetical protein